MAYLPSIAQRTLYSRGYYLLKHGVLLFRGQVEVSLLTGAKLGRLLVKLLLSFPDGTDLFAAKLFQGLDKLLVGPIQLQETDK